MPCTYTLNLMKRLLYKYGNVPYLYVQKYKNLTIRVPSQFRLSGIKPVRQKYKNLTIGVPSQFRLSDIKPVRHQEVAQLASTVPKNVLVYHL